MDIFEAENKKIRKIKQELRKKLRKKGLSEQQIDIKMIEMDVEFLRHVFLNGTIIKDNTIKGRLKFYTGALKTFLKE